jgi:hypothetical protein
MGWGLIGGAAVNAYNNQNRLDQELAYNRMRTAEEARQIAMRTAADAAANGSGEDQAPPVDQSQTAAPAAGLQMPQPPQAPGPDAPPLDGALAGNPDSTYVAPAATPKAPTVGTGLAAAPTAPSPQPPLKPSQVLARRAQAMMNAGGGVEGLKTALATHQQSIQMAQQERDQELMGIMRGSAPFEIKVQQLTGLIDGSDHVPGSASVQQGPDGSYYLQHTAPGKDKPFVMKLEGSNPQEVLTNLAMNVRAMTDSGLAMDMMKQRETAGFHKGELDNRAEMNAVRQDAAAMRLEGVKYAADARAEANAARLEAMGVRNQALSDKASRQNWQPIGTDKDGNTWERDSVFGEVRKMNVPQGITLFPKQTGTGKGAGQTHVLDDREKLAYTAALQELPPKATPADKLAIAGKYNLDPSLFGATPLPPPTALGMPPKAAAAPARGLQMAPNPQAETLKMNLDNAKNMLSLQKPGSISYKLWQDRYNGYQQQLSALQSK